MRFVSYILHFALWWQNRQKCSGKHLDWVVKWSRLTWSIIQKGDEMILKEFLCPHTFFPEFTSLCILRHNRSYQQTPTKVCSKRINSSSSLCTHWIRFFYCFVWCFFYIFCISICTSFAYYTQLNWRFYLGNIIYYHTKKVFRYIPFFI